MEFRFDAILCSNLGNEKSYAGHIQCSRGPHLARMQYAPHPCIKGTTTGIMVLLLLSELLHPLLGSTRIRGRC